RPYVAGASPNNAWISGWVRPDVPGSLGSLGGTNGTQFAVSTKNRPTSTNSTATPTLTSTASRFTHADSLIPPTSTAVRARISNPAGRLMTPSSVLATAVGIAKGVPASAVARYPDHPPATAAAATKNSRT